MQVTLSSYLFFIIKYILIMPSNQKRAFYCHCDECKNKTERPFVSFSVCRYHKRAKLFSGSTYKNWKDTYGKYTYTYRIFTSLTYYDLVDRR